MVAQRRKVWGLGRIRIYGPWVFPDSPVVRTDSRFSLPWPSSIPGQGTKILSLTKLSRVYKPLSAWRSYRRQIFTLHLPIKNLLEYISLKGDLRQGVDSPPPQSKWRFIPCGLKCQDKNSRTIETGGWALPRQHISLSSSKKITHTQKDYLKMMWWSDAKGSDEKWCSTHRPL